MAATEVDRLRGELPELPIERRERFMQSLGLTAADATLLTGDRSLADYFEAVLGPDTSVESAKTAANWVLNELLGLQRERGLDPEELPVSSGQLRELIALVNAKEVTQRAAKELLPQIQADEAPRAAAERLNLLSLDDESAILTAVAETLAAFPEAAADYRKGKTAAIGRLIGETIKRTGGRANPDAVRRLLVEALVSE